jgi:hypothetical protein
MNSFATGVIVQYKEWVGEVRFVCGDYVSICTSVGKHISEDICVLVYKNNWNQVKLLKESDK